MLNIKTIDAGMLSRMFLAGAKNLEAKKEWINELNVFPVPDGDTGTNMTMTIMAAAAEVGSLGEPDMESLAKAISSGSLRGARGNSGVILSQLLRGFTRSVKNSKELDAIDIAAAMEKGVETAYKAVMKPKEGTILTVAREAAAKKHFSFSIYFLLIAFHLPVLKGVPQQDNLHTKVTACQNSQSGQQEPNIPYPCTVNLKIRQYMQVRPF